MKQTKTLDKIISIGYTDTNECFADCRIYKRNDERILYSPFEDEVKFKYVLKDE